MTYKYFVQPFSGIKTYLFAAALCLLLATDAVGTIVGTAHDTEFSADGSSCSACHLPHQASGEKFWAQELVYEGKVGAVSAMCGSCHHSGEGYGSLMTRAHSDDYVYGPDSHGQLMYATTPPPATDIAGSGLPTTATEHEYFECTACHSVHDDTHRPFLRAPINVLCANCHLLRHYVDGVPQGGMLAISGNWGGRARMGELNPGSHPVGEDITELSSELVSIPGLFKIPLSPAPGKWSLGPHLSQGTSGGVTCITCHAVHGTKTDEDDVDLIPMEQIPSPGFLALKQSTMIIGGREVANGSGGYNALCEACHGRNNNPVKDHAGNEWLDLEHNVNPGPQGSYSHPIDTYPSSGDMGVLEFPEFWPEGDPLMAGENVSPVPICESCHAPHIEAAISALRPDVSQEAKRSMLRAPVTSMEELPFCDNCHSQSVENHHPTNKFYDSSGAYYLAGVFGREGDYLTCTTCHLSAHDWGEPSEAAMDPGWKPFNNGRSNIQAEDMYNEDMSKTCMDCHYSMDGDKASVSPTMGINQTVITPQDEEFFEYQITDRSMGTHYIGLIHEERDKWRKDPLLDVFNTQLTWKAQKSTNGENGGEGESAEPSPLTEGLADGWARYGGTNQKGSRVLVCESCHELEPDKNSGFKHLLLAPYEEGKNGYNEYPGDTDGRDILCEICHGFPEGTHPLTNSIVSRTEKPLSASAAWIRAETLGYATMDRDLDLMSCDSCHQPHDANNNSYTFILDSPEEGPIGEYEQIPVGPGEIDLTNPSAANTYGFGVAYGEQESYYATPTLVGTGGPYSGLCFQCHNK